MSKTDTTIYDSDFTPIMYQDATEGISRGKASHLIPKTKWWDSLNFRFARGKVEQIASLKPALQLPGGDVGDVQVLAVVNVNSINATLATLSQTKLYSVTLSTFTATAVGSTYPASDVWTRWAWMTDLTTLYFTKPEQQVQKYIPGTGVSNLITSGPAYGARYMVNFYNHLVLANTYDATNTERPNRIAWSDVSDFTNFLPSPTNEADFYELETVGGNSLNGAMITGMGKIGGSLYIYTANSIWQMQYVGLPNVMITQVRLRNIGNQYPHSLAEALDTHYFIGAGGFYTFDGTSVRPFGEEIWEYFRDSLTNVSDYQNKTHCIVDSRKQEIVWYYCSRNSDGSIDKGLIYNIVEQTWAPIEGRKVMSMQGTTLRNYASMDTLTGTTMNSLLGTMNDLVGATPFGYVLFGTTNGYIRREVTPDEVDFTDVLPESLPYLETGDINYGSLGVNKELSGLRLDAHWKAGTDVTVSLYGRFYITEPTLTRPYWQSDVEYPIGTEISYAGKLFKKTKDVPAPVGYVFIDPTWLPLWTDSRFGPLTFNIPTADVYPDDAPYTGPVFTFSQETGGSFIVGYDGGGTAYTGTYYDGIYPTQEGGDENLLYYVPPTATAERNLSELLIFDTITLRTRLTHLPPGQFVQNFGYEWEQFAFSSDYNGLSEFGHWQPKQIRTTAGWLQTSTRLKQQQIDRVHRWRFTFNGPTNNNAPQPQGATFYAFEENVYTSKSEL